MNRVALACAPIAFAMALFLSRAPGPAVSPDAASYLCASEFIARGEQPRVPFADWFEADSASPLKHFPPGFPALTALPIALGAPVLQAARSVEALAFGATATLVAIAAGSAAGTAAGALAALMVVLTPAVAQTHTMVLSEPVFLALLALLLVLMVRAPARVLPLGLVAGVAVLVRYAGASLVAAVVLHACLQPGSLRERARRACVAALPPIVALAGWRASVGPFREYRYRSGLSSQAGDAWQTIAEWIVPVFEPSVLRSVISGAVLLAVVVVCGIGSLRRADTSDPRAGRLRSLQRACALIVACYLGVVIASRVFADPDIPFDWRLMAPVTLLVATCFAATLVSGWQSWSGAARSVSAALVASWLVGSAWALISFSSGMHAKLVSGEGTRWRQSQLAHWLRNEGSTLTLYSDDPTTIWHLSHRSSRLLPRKDDPVAVQRFGLALRREPSAVLGFAWPLMDTVPPAKLAERLALGAPTKLDLATLWVVRPAPSPR